MDIIEGLGLGIRDSVRKVYGYISQCCAIIFIKVFNNRHLTLWNGTRKNADFVLEYGLKKYFSALFRLS